MGPVRCRSPRIALVAAAWLAVCGCTRPYVVSRVTVQAVAPGRGAGTFTPTETICVHLEGSSGNVRWKVNYPDRSVYRESAVDQRLAEKLFRKLNRLGIWRLRDAYDPSGAHIIVKIARDGRSHMFRCREAGAYARVVRLCRDFAEAHATETTEFAAEPGGSAGR